MFKLIIVTVLLGLACADNINKDAEIVNLKNDAADAEGHFAYAFETSNGISAQQSGDVAGVSGSAQWVAPEGDKISLQYTADENGYHPTGAHLPVAPAIPAAIIRALEYISSHPSAEDRQGGSINKL